MDIQIIEHIKETLQVVIKCRQIEDEIVRLKYHIEMFDKKLQAKKIMNGALSTHLIYCILNPWTIVLFYILKTM